MAATPPSFVEHESETCFFKHFQDTLEGSLIFRSLSIGNPRLCKSSCTDSGTFRNATGVKYTIDMR
eukprot:3007661-Amphidinium_carterae.4